jgi:hypothetical protein
MFTVSAGNNLLLYRNSIYNNVGCNKLLFVFFILCFHKLHICVLISGQDCNSGMQKRIHFRTDVEHNICGPVNNSDVSLGYQFCKNITFILYIIYNVRYNNIYCPFNGNMYLIWERLRNIIFLLTWNKAIQYKKNIIKNIWQITMPLVTYFKRRIYIIIPYIIYYI